MMLFLLTRHTARYHFVVFQLCSNFECYVKTKYFPCKSILCIYCLMIDCCFYCYLIIWFPLCIFEVIHKFLEKVCKMACGHPRTLTVSVVYYSECYITYA